MRKLLLILSLLAFGIPKAEAQFASFGKFPVDITSDQETRFVGGVAVAEQNVVIRYRDTTIYADYAEYNDETRDVLVRGNVRIFREGHTFIGDRAVYNLETKQLRAADFRGDYYPFKFTAESLTAMSANEYLLKDASLTTSDSSNPDYHLRARNVRIYAKDHVVMRNVSLYIGQTPVFWWPYLYQSLDQTSSFNVSPGYRSNWGAYLLYAQDFPITDDIKGTVHLDYRANRGLAYGLDAQYKSKTDQSWAKFRSYALNDADPGKYKIPAGVMYVDLNKHPYGYTPLTQNNFESKSHKVNPDRYRVSFQSKYFLSDDVYATFNVNKLSDPNLMKEFFLGEYRLDPQPDNVVALTKLEENYSLTATARIQLNNFFDTTERLPEFAFDMKRTALFSSPVYYEGETGAARLLRRYPNGELDQLNYAANRLDSFHQLTLPVTIGNWLSIIPRIGVRGTYYSPGEQGTMVTALTESPLKPRSGTHPKGLPVNSTTVDEARDQIFYSALETSALQHLAEDPAYPYLAKDPYFRDLQHAAKAPISSRGKIQQRLSPTNPYDEEFRGVFNAGVESSFKASREWNDLQSRALGLDGLRHVVQPYTDFSYVRTNVGPDQIPQFDRLLATDQLPSFTFPQFNGIDSISNWTVWRLGVRNRLQTRRDDQTINWLEADSFFNVNIDEPTLPGGIKQGGVSNFYNQITFRPLSWASLRLDSQIPLNSNGYTVANTSLNFFATKDLQLEIGHRFLNGNPYFENSNRVSVGGLYRFNENWSVSALDEYEFHFRTLEWQRYEIHRDLSSWIVSFGFSVQNNNPNPSDYAVLLTFTLKAFPIINLPLSEDPAKANN